MVAVRYLVSYLYRSLFLATAKQEINISLEFLFSFQVTWKDLSLTVYLVLLLSGLIERDLLLLLRAQGSSREHHLNLHA